MEYGFARLRLYFCRWRIVVRFVYLSLLNALGPMCNCIFVILDGKDDFQERHYGSPSHVLNVVMSVGWKGPTARSSFERLSLNVESLVAICY